MDELNIVQGVKDVGFPIFVAGWLLIRQSKLTAELTAALNGLQAAINMLISRESKNV